LGSERKLPLDAVFDEDRFIALLNLADPATGLELVMRLDEDLSGLAAGLSAAGQAADHQKLRQFSHVLLAITGTVGADQLFALAERLNQRVRSPNAGPLAELLHEIDLGLTHLIHRIRLARTALTAQP
jgi:two-component system aerobic respiration control sensor histidine kinase ArcB